jgi:subtilisin family serine protease
MHQVKFRAESSARFEPAATFPELQPLTAFASPDKSPDLGSVSTVVRAEVDVAGLKRLQEMHNVRIYPASPLEFFAGCNCSGAAVASAAPSTPQRIAERAAMDLGRTAGGTDCQPFAPAVDLDTIRTLLGVDAIWAQGFRGQNIVVAIVDIGVNGDQYPVIGGLDAAFGPAPGSAPITSHGSMCAADVLVAAPFAKLYDYPLLNGATSADGFQIYQQILDRRRQDGTPQVINNSYGFYALPTQQELPGHEAWDINHPFHRKVREVIASGALVFFAAGNCGSGCPASRCKPSATGPNRSINASAAVPEVLTIAAVNARHQRVGYSSQGPSLPAPGFEPNKPDFACYTHFFGNFGPDRPGGTAQPFDNGTSAATPVAAGVATLLLSRFADLTPAQIRDGLKAGAIDIGKPGWDTDTGFGVINAAASYTRLLQP